MNSQRNHTVTPITAGRSVVKATCLLAVTEIGLVIGIMEQGSRGLQSELFLWLPVLQAIAAGVIAWRCRRPQTWCGWTVVLLIHLGLAGIPVLIAGDYYRWWRAGMWECLFRVFLSALWLLPVCGLILLAETVRRGRLKWKPWVPSRLRLCMAATLVLVGLESTAWIIEGQQRPAVLTPPVPPAATDNVVRIATVGGSTMRGFPYEPEFGIAQAALCELQHRFPNRTFDLQNLAETGVNLEQAIAKTHRLTVRPDVLIVYSGHNQFFHNVEELALARKTEWKIDQVLRLSPMFRLLQPRMAQQTLATAAAEQPETLCGRRESTAYLERVRLQRYRQQLAELLQWCHACDTTVVFCVPAADEATFAPSRSWCQTTDANGRAKLQDTWRRVRNLQQQQEWQAALTLCESVLQDEPYFAEFLYLAGRSCRALGPSRHAAAHRHFEAALTWDQFPIRARPAYCQAGRDVAREHAAHIVDCPELLRQESADGFLDDQFFLDGVHPNLAACFLVGQAVAAAVVDSGVVDATLTNTSPLSFAECLQRRQVTSQVLARAYTTTTRVFRQYAKFRSATDSDREQAAERYAAMATRLIAGDVSPGHGGTESLEHP